MIKLTKEQILILHSELIKMTGGSDGIRDIGLFESALETPFQSYELSDLILDVTADKKQYEDILQWLLVHQI